MIVTIGGIPVYDAIIADDQSGMLKISLVDDPAVMSNFQAFDGQKKLLLYSIEDEEKRLVRGVVMRADFPIYRYDKEFGEYYIMYKADTIRQMAEKYLVENRQNNFNLMHEEGSDVEGVQMVQFFIKDSEGGVAPSGFDGIADGSLFGEFHVTNDEVWDEIKAGTYKGFSLEGIFDLVPEQDAGSVEDIVESLDGKFRKIFKHSKSNNMSKWQRFKAGLARLLEEFGSITTDKGVLAWDGDDDLKAGDSVYIEDAEGNRTPAEDGDYKTDDNKTIKVVDGKVSEIADPESEASTEEEMGSKSTDKGDLLWDGEDDLKEGDEVFVLNEDGERIPAEDGEYTTEDGKVIKVTDGKVESITDKEAEVSTDLKAKRQARFAKVRQAFEDSYEEKERKIMEAIAATLAEGQYAYLVEAGDGYAVIYVYDDLDWEGKYIKYEVSWDESGNPTIGASEEVKSAFVPVDAPNPADETPSEEDFAALRKENGDLKAEVAKLKKTPAAKPAHEEVETSFEIQKTGDKKLDRLAEKAALARQARAGRK